MQISLQLWFYWILPEGKHLFLLIHHDPWHAVRGLDTELTEAIPEKYLIHDFRKEFEIPHKKPRPMLYYMYSKINILYYRLS